MHLKPAASLPPGSSQVVSGTDVSWTEMSTPGKGMESSQEAGVLS